MEVFYLLLYTEIESRNTMTKISAYRDVKYAITNGILRSNEVFTPSALETVDDLQTLIALSKKNLEGIHNLTRSLEVNTRYHQGRAIVKNKEDSASLDTLGLTKSFRSG